MDYQNNLRYFTKSLKDRSSVIRFCIAGALPIIGYIVYRYLWDIEWIIRNVIFIAFCAIAAALVYSVFAKQTKGRELDVEAAMVVKAFSEEVETTLLPSGNARQMKLSEDRKKHSKQFSFCSYQFGKDGLTVKRGTDNTLRSSVYCASIVWLFKDEIGVGSTAFSLIEPDKTEKKIKLLPYTSLREAAVVTPALPPAQYGVSYVEISLQDSEGKILFSLPAVGDSVTDEFVAELNRRIEHANSRADASAD